MMRGALDGNWLTALSDIQAFEHHIMPCFYYLPAFFNIVDRFVISVHKQGGFIHANSLA